MTKKELIEALERILQEADDVTETSPQEWDALTLLADLRDGCRGVTLQELSSRTGINISNLSLILQGKRVPRLDTFVQIAKAVNMEIACKR